MRVLCKSDYPDKQQLRQLGKKFYRCQTFGLEVDREYLVVGLSLVTGSYLGQLPLVEYFNGDHLLSAPIVLFQVINPRVSNLWLARYWPDGSVTLRPSLLYEEFFHDRFSDYEPEARAAFMALYEVLKAEDEQ